MNEYNKDIADYSRAFEAVINNQFFYKGAAISNKDNFDSRNEVAFFIYSETVSEDYNEQQEIGHWDAVFDIVTDAWFNK